MEQIEVASRLGKILSYLTRTWYTRFFSILSTNFVLYINWTKMCLNRTKSAYIGQKCA